MLSCISTDVQTFINTDQFVFEDKTQPIDLAVGTELY
jgi:hypothetical protein